MKIVTKKFKRYVIMIDGKTVYYHNTFQIFTSMKPNEFAFYTKDEVEYLKGLTTNDLDIFEVTEFNLKKVKNYES